MYRRSTYGGRTSRAAFARAFKPPRPLWRTSPLLLDPERNVETALSAGVEVLNQRSIRIAPFVHELMHREEAGRLPQPLTAIVPSYVHMHVNRLLRSAHRRQEVVLYDFLGRFYQSHAVRASRGAE